ncbi:4-hydroxy-tetrahydrodipicolinate synthase [bacterium]|nr:4-hydroxy-tetrahydrodipicolinate synthase [bacterium]
MPRKGEQFAGVTVAMVTPMHADGSVNEDGLRQLVDWHVESGTDCLCPVGTTGESPTLTHDEHQRVISIVCEHAKGRIKVMAGTGSNSTSEAISLTQFAKDCGADGAMMVAPYYNKPTQEGFYQHYKAVAEAVDIPIILYNIPGRTAKNMEPDTLVRLGEIRNIVAVKEATGLMDQASQVLSASNITVLSGDDSLTLPLMSMGGSGVVSVVGNIVPQDMKALITAFNSGDMAEAQRMHHKLFQLCRDLLGLSTNPIPIKIAMRLLNRDAGPLRLPLTPLTEAEESNLRQTLTRYGLL